VSPAAAPLKLGTRGSPLALAQAAQVAAAIDGPVELTTITTSGDGDEAPAEDKRRWVDRIEDALLAGAIDLAVHSAKDLPGTLAGGLTIAGAPQRADAPDRSRSCLPARGSVRAACAAPRSSARCARTSRSFRSPATSTRASHSSRRMASTRWS
jgi:hypothetical protein